MAAAVGTAAVPRPMRPAKAEKPFNNKLCGNMMMRRCLVPVFLCGLLLLTGCATIDRRAGKAIGEPPPAYCTTKSDLGMIFLPVVVPIMSLRDDNQMSRSEKIEATAWMIWLWPIMLSTSLIDLPFSLTTDTVMFRADRRAVMRYKELSTQAGRTSNSTPTTQQPSPGGVANRAAPEK